VDVSDGARAPRRSPGGGGGDDDGRAVRGGDKRGALVKVRGAVLRTVVLISCGVLFLGVVRGTRKTDAQKQRLRSSNQFPLILGRTIRTGRGDD